MKRLHAELAARETDHSSDQHLNPNPASKTYW
jgi:hypothetical protein